MGQSFNRSRHVNFISLSQISALNKVEMNFHFCPNYFSCETECVNENETQVKRIYCGKFSFSIVGWGGLIQAACGSVRGAGTFLTNLSGCVW